MGLDGMMVAFLLKFDLGDWLAQLNKCINDVEDGGRYNDDMLDLSLPLEDGEDCDPCELPQSQWTQWYDCPDDVPTAACCAPDGSCAEATKNGCATVYQGVWHPGQSCDSVSCPPVTTACCLPSGNCQYLAPQACSVAQGSSVIGAS